MGSETAIIRLDRPVPGFDHSRAVDPTLLCSVLYSVDTDAELLNLEPLKSFGVWPNMKPRWWPASAGLKTVRGLIKHYGARGAVGAF